MRHVIFDCGQVLVRFEPAYMVGRYVTDPADKALLEAVVFDRLYWDRLDDGTITDSEVLAKVRTRLPQRLWETADTIYYNWIYNIPEIPGMSDLVTDLKAAGKGVYLLSNISTYFAAHREEIAVLRHFDGCVFSACCGLVKPDEAIFRYLCDTYGLDPSDCLFVDDREENVEAARRVGMQGYVFDGDAAALRERLKNEL